MKSVNATRWTREAILAIGNITAQDGEGEGEGQGGESGGSGQANSGTETKETETGGAGKETEAEEKDPEVLRRKLKNKTEEQDRQFKLLQQERKRADDLQKVQDEADRKGKTELENAKADLEKRDAELKAKDDTIRRLTIENAFSKLDGITWHDADDALRFVDLSDVEFDGETGKVKDKAKLVAAAKELAKNKPYLVKKEEAGQEKKGSAAVRTGTAPSGGKTILTDEAALRKKYNIRN